MVPVTPHAVLLSQDLLNVFVCIPSVKHRNKYDESNNKRMVKVVGPPDIRPVTIPGVLKNDYSMGQYYPQIIVLHNAYYRGSPATAPLVK